LGNKLASDESVYFSSNIARNIIAPALALAAPCVVCKQISVVVTTDYSLQIAINTSLLLRILDSTIADDICCFTFWAVGGVHDLRNSLIASTLSQQDASSRGMGEDMSTNRLATVSAGE